jgi:hypothetical protein
VKPSPWLRAASVFLGLCSLVHGIGTIHSAPHWPLDVILLLFTVLLWKLSVHSRTHPDRNRRPVLWLLLAMTGFAGVGWATLSIGPMILCSGAAFLLAGEVLSWNTNGPFGSRPDTGVTMSL